MIGLHIGVRANVLLGGGQTEFCPNGFSGGGGVVAEIFRDPCSCGVAEFFALSVKKDPKFVLFKHVLCFARIISTLCPNSCRQTARIGGWPPCPPVPYANGPTRFMSIFLKILFSVIMVRTPNRTSDMCAPLCVYLMLNINALAKAGVNKEDRAISHRV